MIAGKSLLNFEFNKLHSRKRKNKFSAQRSKKERREEGHRGVKRNNAYSRVIREDSTERRNQRAKVGARRVTGSLREKLKT